VSSPNLLTTSPLIPPSLQTQTQEESSEEDEEPRRPAQKNGRRTVQSEDETDEGEEDEGDEEMEVDADADSQDQVVKKLVRYALACEYQRVSIKRTGITEKGQHALADQRIGD
jgi:hypothetical protein